MKREPTDVRKTDDPKYPSNHVMIFPGSVLPKFTTKIKMIFLFEHFSSFKDEVRYHPCVNVYWKTEKKKHLVLLWLTPHGLCRIPLRRWSQSLPLVLPR